MLPRMAKKEVDSYLLRLPKPLREKLEQATVESGRTLRAEIIERLESTFADPNDTDLADRVAEHERRIADLEQVVAERRRR